MMNSKIRRDYDVILEIRRAGLSYIAYVRKEEVYSRDGHFNRKYILHEAGDSIEGSGVTIFETVEAMFEHLKKSVTRWVPIDSKTVVKNLTEEFLGADVIKFTDSDFSWIFKPIVSEGIDSKGDDEVSW